MSQIFHHGPRLDADGSVCWELWAPRAAQATLILEPGPCEIRIPLQPRENGWFTHVQPAVAEGCRYLFDLDGRTRLPDPASRWQPQGVHAASAVFHPGRFKWTDGQWRGIPLSNLVIYELHVGTFTPEGTLDGIIPRLPDLRNLGVTAIELMPLAQFPGERGWGYDGVFPFAVQQSYGGPAALQKLVDACHGQGLAVFLDVVYNHFGPEGNYLAQFGPYFTEKYQTPWGTAIHYDGDQSEGVRQFVLDNVSWWLGEFHLDGLRLDAIHAIYDQGPCHLLRVIRETADVESHRTGRQIHIMAESNLNDVRVLDAHERGGYGLDAQWSDDFHHSVHTLLTAERAGYYADFGDPRQLTKALGKFFVYDGCFSPYRQRLHGGGTGQHSGDRFIISIQNHDQIGNRALGERLGSLLTMPQQRLAAALMLLAPNLPLLFMGEEYGETNPFLFFCDFSEPALVEAVRRGRAAEFASFAWPECLPDPFAKETFAASRVSWNWKEDLQRSGLRNWYQTLLRTRRELTALKNFVDREATWHCDAEENGGTIELVRGNPDSDSCAIAYFNCSRAIQNFPLRSHVQKSPGRWQALLSSEQVAYGGQRQNPDWSCQPPGLLPYEAQLFTLNERTSL